MKKALIFLAPHYLLQVWVITNSGGVYCLE